MLADAPEADRLFVAALRLWLASPEGPSHALAHLSLTLGPAAGRRASAALSACLSAVADGAVRRFWRHRPGCACMGRDEAALCALIAAAGAGALETAYGAAAALVRPEALFPTVESAAQLGRALRRRPESDAAAPRATRR
jgi:hypothetical protein